MARAIVHIGYHKTASTWFQKSVYPRVKNFAYVPRERVNHALLDASALHFDAERSRAQLALPEGAAPILCEEALSGALLSGGFLGFQSAEIARRIHALLPDARIVVFVRSQPEMITAAYLQYLRVGGTYSARRFLWPSDYSRADATVPYREPHFSFDHFDYDRLVAHYIALFGAERVHAYAYEELRRDGPVFLERFAKELGLKLDLAAVTMEKRNASYGLAVSRMARALNLFTALRVSNKHYWLHVPYWYAARKRLLEGANASGVFRARATPERVLGSETVAWIRQRYCESNRRLAELTRIDLRALGYALDPPASPARRPAVGILQRWASR
jgi:hypothetical protein